MARFPLTEIVNVLTDMDMLTSRTRTSTVGEKAYFVGSFMGRVLMDRALFMFRSIDIESLYVDATRDA